MNYTALKTPGVYVNEISIFPPSVAQVPTAIPAFIGYTERRVDENGESLHMKPKKISSFVEFQLLFGGAPPVDFSKIELDASGQVVKVESTQSFYLSDSLQMFFANGGG
ncbi:MAG: phage tail protein, partial [Chitinophagaceae bacterium]|nr:phage tail protein [Chitinophagaceae bacterium]